LLKSIKSFLKETVPPVVIRFYLSHINPPYEFHGDYPTWEEARADSLGYEDPSVFSQVRQSALRVKAGEAAYEQDSLLFFKPSFSWPILAALLRVASLNQNRLHVLDVGGSLGSVYYRHKRFLTSLSELRWAVVEQENFVNYGKQDFEDEHLRFYEALTPCALQEDTHVVLLSSVLPYLEKPYDLLQEIISLQIRHMIIDRHPLILSGEQDRLTVQEVKAFACRASYPAWFFSNKKFFDFILRAYEILATFDCPVWSNIRCDWKGFILERRCQ
jgi:putative methyltransferase (TIGR04325 family)